MITFTAKKNLKLSKYTERENIGIPYFALQKLLRKKDVKINGKRIDKDVLLNVGDKVDIYYSEKEKAKDKCIAVFEDDNVLIVDKFGGILSEDLFSLLKEEYKELYFIHRLDRNTSGLMIFAKNPQAEEELLKGFKNRTFDKKYIAAVYGKMPEKTEILTGYLLKDKETSTVKVFDKKVSGAVPIKTGYRVLSEEVVEGITVSTLEVTLFTGKTHQIRAHLASIGHFVLGDGKYGDNKINKKLKVKNQTLRSYSITFAFSKDSFLSYLNGKTFSIKD